MKRNNWSMKKNVRKSNSLQRINLKNVRKSNSFQRINISLSLHFDFLCMKRNVNSLRSIRVVRKPNSLRRINLRLEINWFYYVSNTNLSLSFSFLQKKFMFLIYLISLYLIMNPFDGWLYTHSHTYIYFP